MTKGRPDATELERVQLLVRGLAWPVARRGYRDRLRDEFVREAMPDRSRDLGRSSGWSLPPVAAVAGAFALLFVFWLLNAGPAWRLTAVSGIGTVQVDGHSVPLDSRANLARILTPGAHVRLPDSTQLDFELRGRVLIQIIGGSDVTLPGRPGRWLGRSMTTSLDAGEIRIATGPAFHGCRFDIVTPEAGALVTGTTLAVLRQPDASCVCVYEGSVTMRGGVAGDTVRSGFRRSVFRDGRPPLLEPIRPMEAMKLSMLHDQAARMLRP